MKSIYDSPRFDDEQEKSAKMPDPFSEKFLKTRQIILTGEINKELAEKWVKCGAEPTETARTLLQSIGVLEVKGNRPPKTNNKKKKA